MKHINAGNTQMMTFVRGMFSQLSCDDVKSEYDIHHVVIVFVIL